MATTETSCLCCCDFADRMVKELNARNLDDSPEAVAVVIDDPVSVSLADSHIDVVVKNFP